MSGKPKSVRAFGWLVAAGLIGLPLAGTLIYALRDDGVRDHQLWKSLAVVTGFVIVTLGLLELASKNESNPARDVGYLKIILGADGRLSTSKAVGFLWTILFGMALVFLSAMTWWANFSVHGAFGQNWDGYFLLLGGPFAAAIAAKGIVVAKVGDDATAKTSTLASSPSVIATPTAGGAPSPADIVSNDNGDPDLIDTQYTLFTIVAVLYFLGALINNIVQYSNGPNAPTGITLPLIPSALLGLTSASALAYVGNKAVQKSGLRLVKFAPASPKQTDAVTAEIANLPASATASNTYLVFTSATGQALPIAPTSVTPGNPTGTLTFTVSTLAIGDYQVSVVAPDLSAGPYPFTIS